MKADAWWLRHNPRVLAFEWRKGIKRADRANGTDVFVTGEIWDSEEGSNERKEWEALFAPGKAPTAFTKEEKSSWFKEIAGKVSLASDAFFPFPDNVMRATRSGVGYFAAPGGSIMDDKVIETANESNAVYIFTELRYTFHFSYLSPLADVVSSSQAVYSLRNEGEREKDEIVLLESKVSIESLRCVHACEGTARGRGRDEGEFEIGI